MQESYRNLVYGVALALMIGWVLHIGSGIIVPVVASVLVVYVVLGLVHSFDRIPVIGPAVPEAVRYIVSIIVIGAILSYGISALINNINQVIAVAPAYVQSLVGLVQRGAEFIGIEQEPTWETIRAEVLGRINVEALIGSTVSSISSIVWVFTLILIYAAFLLAERASFAGKIGFLSGDPAKVARIHTVIGDINDRIGTYLALKTLINIILGVISYAIMTVLGIEFAGFWAVLIALLNYIPYLGSFLGVAFPVALSFLQFGDLYTALIVLAALSAAQFFVGYFLEPWMMGSSLNLSPFVILVSLAVWSALWGIAGALLAVPITAIIVIVLSEFDGTRPIAVLLSLDGQVSRPEPRPRRAASRDGVAAALPGEMPRAVSGRGQGAEHFRER